MKSILPLILLIIVACVSEDSGPNKREDASPHNLDTAECSACGMVVREQPSPRAQAIHRDGERVWFCSLADMMVYLKTPSPHGVLNKIYVETMPPDQNYRDADKAPLQWMEAHNGFYVRGLQKPTVMGEPVLAYGKLDAAQRVAGELNTSVLNWTALKAAINEGVMK